MMSALLNLYKGIIRVKHGGVSRQNLSQPIPSMRSNPTAEIQPSTQRKRKCQSIDATRTLGSWWGSACGGIQRPQVTHQKQGTNTYTEQTFQPLPACKQPNYPFPIPPTHPPPVTHSYLVSPVPTPPMHLSFFFDLHMPLSGSSHRTNLSGLVQKHFQG